MKKIKRFFCLIWQNKGKILSWLWNKLICESLWQRLKRLLICFDQFLNVLILNGREDETLSSRFYRWGKKDGIFWKFPVKITDTLFFFDYETDKNRKVRHCEKSYLREMQRQGFPLEMR